MRCYSLTLTEQPVDRPGRLMVEAAFLWLSVPSRWEAEHHSSRRETRQHPHLLRPQHPQAYRLWSVQGDRQPSLSSLLVSFEPFLLETRGQPRLITLFVRQGVHVTGEGSQRMSGNTGAWRYMAPEVFSDGQDGYTAAYSSSADVFSAGMVMWYMYHGEPPHIAIEPRLLAELTAR